MQAWTLFLKELEKDLGKETIEKWLLSLKIVQFDAGNLYLQAKDAFQILWFEEHIRSHVKHRLLNNNKRPIKVHLSVNSPSFPLKKNLVKTPIKSTHPAFAISFENLNPYYTFDTFIPQKEELSSFAFLKKLDKEIQFNPIYIYGEKGSGKTHLLHATAHNLEKKGLKIVFSTLENFTDHVVNAIRLGEMHQFREAYRNCDVLILDNIHLLSKKWATQEELFHTFNTLHLSGKQIVLSSNCLPNQLVNIEPRLVSRFEWGIVLPTPVLEKENLKQLLEIKSKALHLSLNFKVTQFLLETFKTPFSLCKAMEALVLRLHLSEKRGFNFSLEVVTSQLSDLISEEKKEILTSEKIIQHVAEYFGLRMEDILGKSQNKECVIPRKIAMYLCRQQLKLPYTKIGESFSKDHSTVMSSVKSIQKELDDYETNTSSIIQALTQKLSLKK